jgi:hypothetical protein
LQEADCQTDLQKLIYTMQKIHTVTQPIQFPQFWNEEWLKIAIDELDSRKMSPDEKASLEILIARNAEAVKADGRKIKDAKQEEKIELITKSLAKGLNIELIADIAGTTVEFVKSVQLELYAN